MGKKKKKVQTPGVDSLAFRPVFVTHDVNVNAAQGGWGYGKTKDSFGNQTPGKGASAEVKNAALNQYVVNISTAWNATANRPGMTTKEAEYAFSGFKSIADKAEAIEDAVNALIYNETEITRATITAQLNKKGKDASGEAEVQEGEEEDQQEIKFDPMHLYAEGFSRSQSSVYEHQPHAAFAGLSGERIETTSENQQNTPFSGEQKSLRHYSPFTIALLPPKEISALNTGSAADKDPYSWSSLGKLTTKIAEQAMVTPETNQSYFSSAWEGDGDRLNKRSMQAAGIEQAISDLNMLVHEGQISTQTDHTLQGNGYKGESMTPLVSVAHIADVYMQLLQMFRTPPLLLLVNPTSMSVTYSKLQSHQERTRYGYIFQAWGEELPVLNFSGRIGAFYGGESPGGRRQFMSFEESTHVSGVQEAARRVSPAYQNLMNLMKLYKNNGYIRDNVGKSQANHLIGMVEISYDGVRYIGHFDKMEYTFEESGNLGGVNFSFDFTATEIRRNEDERHPYVMKMSNPNEGGRFGDGSSDQKYSSMAQFLQEAERTGSSGWDLQSNNDFNDENPDEEGTQNSVLDSWAAQTQIGSEDNDGDSGWGTRGIQIRGDAVNDYDPDDFEG